MDDNTCILMAKAMICFSAATFIYLRYQGPIGYGKHLRLTMQGLPSWISWMIIMLPSLIIPAYYVSYGKSTRSILLNVFLCGHFFNKALIFPFRIRSCREVPWYIILMGFILSTFNAFMQSVWNSFYLPNETSPYITYIGLSIHLIGFELNSISDDVLFKLRDHSTGYGLPRGQMFDYVSCPNYLGEIIEWIGYAIAARSLPSLAFALFTICNLGPRAMSHHQWYHERFGRRYPQNRKALIPFVW